MEPRGSTTSDWTLSNKLAWAWDVPDLCDAIELDWAYGAQDGDRENNTKGRPLGSIQHNDQTAISHGVTQSDKDNAWRKKTI